MMKEWTELNYYYLEKIIAFSKNREINIQSLENEEFNTNVMILKSMGYEQTSLDELKTGMLFTNHGNGDLVKSMLNNLEGNQESNFVESNTERDCIVTQGDCTVLYDKESIYVLSDKEILLNNFEISQCLRHKINLSNIKTILMILTTKNRKLMKIYSNIEKLNLELNDYNVTKNEIAEGKELKLSNSKAYIKLISIEEALKYADTYRVIRDTSF